MKTLENIGQLALNNLQEKLKFTLEGKRQASFYLYFTKEYQATQASATLINLQFDTEVNYSEYGNKWLWLATKNINMTSNPS